MASVEVGEPQKLQEMELKLKAADEDANVAKSEVNLLVNQEHNTKPQVMRHMIVNNARKLERLRDRPKMSSEMTIDEWVNETGSHLATSQLNNQDQAAFIVEQSFEKSPHRDK